MNNIIVYLALSVRDLWEKGVFNPNAYGEEFRVFIALANLLSNAARIFVLLAGVGAILGIIWGGYLMITAAGDTSKITQGKQTILWALIGLVFIALIPALIWLIIKILSPLPYNLPLSSNLISSMWIK